MEDGTAQVRIEYQDQGDLLYIRLDEEPAQVVNKRISEDMVLDLGRDDRIVGIEILNASDHLDVNRLLSGGCHVAVV